jgi:hypothetical protein
MMALTKLIYAFVNPPVAKPAVGPRLAETDARSIN